MKILFPGEFPEIQTPRLKLRQPRPEDHHDLFRLYADPLVMQHRGIDCFTSTNQTEEFILELIKGFNDKTSLRWIITFEDDDNLIGSCGFKKICNRHYRGEISYELDPELWNKGIMTEALEPVLHYGFNIGMHSIEANIAPENYASERVLLKHGFLKEAHFKQNYFYNGNFIDSVIYSKLNPASL